MITVGYNQESARHRLDLRGNFQGNPKTPGKTKTDPQGLGSLSHSEALSQTDEILTPKCTYLSPSSSVQHVQLSMKDYKEGRLNGKEKKEHIKQASEADLDMTEVFELSDQKLKIIMIIC